MIFSTKTILAMRIARALNCQTQRSADLANIVHNVELLSRTLRKLMADRLVYETPNGTLALTPRGRALAEVTTPLLNWIEADRQPIFEKINTGVVDVDCR